MSSSQDVVPTSRLRERLLSSLSKGNASKAAKLSATKKTSLAPLVSPTSVNRPVNIPTVPIPPATPRSKSNEPPIRSNASQKKQNKIIDIDHNNQRHKKDQPTRLLKRLPQAKVLGDVDLKHLIKKNDLVVVINEEADDVAESSSLDSSVADEKAGLKKSGLKSALITSSNQLKLSKKVMFIGGERDGAEVSAIYLYESVPVDVPWQLPKCRGEVDLKAHRGGPIPAALLSAPIGFRSY